MSPFQGEDAGSIPARAIFCLRLVELVDTSDLKSGFGEVTVQVR